MNFVIFNTELDKYFVSTRMGMDYGWSNDDKRAVVLNAYGVMEFNRMHRGEFDLYKKDASRLIDMFNYVRESSLLYESILFVPLKSNVPSFYDACKVWEI